jgi:hypothetical protein
VGIVVRIFREGTSRGGGKAWRVDATPERLRSALVILALWGCLGDAAGWVVGGCVGGPGLGVRSYGALRLGERPSSSFSRFATQCKGELLGVKAAHALSTFPVGNMQMSNMLNAAQLVLVHATRARAFNPRGTLARYVPEILDQRSGNSR